LKVGIHTKVGQLLKITLYVDFAGNIFLRKTHGTFSENFLDGFLPFDDYEKGGFTAAELFNFIVPIPNFERNFGKVAVQCPEQLLKGFLHTDLYRKIYQSLAPLSITKMYGAPAKTHFMIGELGKVDGHNMLLDQVSPECKDQRRKER
jgi:hypothetical protein